MLADLAVAERPGREPLDGGARILRREQWGPADEPWRKRPFPADARGGTPAPAERKLPDG